MSEVQTEMNLDDALEANKIEQAALVAAIKARDAEKRTAALAPVLAVIREHAFTAAELGFATRAEKITASAPKAERTTVEPRYRDPDGASTWTGRGKTPAWMAAQLAAGKVKEDFLIVKPTAPAESGAPVGTGTQSDAALPADTHPDAA